jgi:hypothetical protein
MWNHMQTQAIPARPLVLIGPGWQETIGTFWRVFDGHVPIQHRSLLTFAEDIEEAISFINHR